MSRQISGISSWAALVTLATVAGLVFSEMLRDHSYELWTDWALSVWGTIQVTGPISAVWAAALAYLNGRDGVATLHRISPRNQAVIDVRTVFPALVGASSAVILITGVTAVYTARSHAFGVPSPLVALLGLLLVPGYVGFGLLVSRVVPGWFGPPTALALAYVLQAYGLYDGAYREALGPVRQLTAGPNTAFDTGASVGLAAWFACGSAALLGLALVRWSRPNLIVVSLTMALALVSAVAVIEGPDLREQRASPVRCSTDGPLVVCVHPQAGGRARQIAANFRDSHQRLALVGLDSLQRVVQAPGPRATFGAKEAVFSLPDPHAPDLGTTVVFEVALGPLAGNCRGIADSAEARSLLRPIVAEWVATGAWPEKGDFADFPTVERVLDVVRDGGPRAVSTLVATLRQCGDVATIQAAT